MTTVNDLTAAPDVEFADVLAYLEAAPADEAGTVEKVARTICESDGLDWGSGLLDDLGLRDDYRRNATSAIGAMKAGAR